MANVLHTILNVLNQLDLVSNISGIWSRIQKCNGRQGFQDKNALYGNLQNSGD